MCLLSRRPGKVESGAFVTGREPGRAPFEPEEEAGERRQDRDGHCGDRRAADQQERDPDQNARRRPHHACLIGIERSGVEPGSN